MNWAFLEALLSIGITVSSLATCATEANPSAEVRTVLEDLLKQLISDAEAFNAQVPQESGTLMEAMLGANKMQASSFASLLTQLKCCSDAAEVSAEFADLIRSVIAATDDALSSRLTLHEELQNAQTDSSFPAPGG